MKSCMKACVKTNLYFQKLTLCRKVNYLNQNELPISNKYHLFTILYEGGKRQLRIKTLVID